MFLLLEKQRFERSLVDTVVKSVQFFLLAPDVLWSPNASRASISQSNVSGHGIPQGCVALLEKKEKEKTIANVNSLAHFRRMLRSMKFFHDQSWFQFIQKYSWNLIICETISTISHLHSPGPIVFSYIFASHFHLRLSL